MTTSLPEALAYLALAEAALLDHQSRAGWEALDAIRHARELIVRDAAAVGSESDVVQGL